MEQENVEIIDLDEVEKEMEESIDTTKKQLKKSCFSIIFWN